MVLLSPEDIQIIESPPEQAFLNHQMSIFSFIFFLNMVTRQLKLVLICFFAKFFFIKFVMYLFVLIRVCRRDFRKLCENPIKTLILLLNILQL